jgi:iron complex outermembrane receptor protein
MKITILTIILLLIPVFLFAQTDTAQTYNLDPITVTATRAAVARSLVSPSVSVISASEISLNPEKSIFSLISQEVPGVFITERDILGFGVNSPSGQINIRGIGGSPNNEVLTLIDGRPQYMGWYGHPINDSYLSTNIERIEVIRGPASMLYGSNAMGGVINIITHTSQQDGLSGNTSISYGSFDAQQYGIHLGYQQNGWNVLGSFTHEHTDGSRPWSEYTANSGYLKTSYQLSEQYRFSLDGSFTRFNTFDPGQITQPDTNDWMHIQRGYIGVSVENDFGISKGGISFVYNLGHNELDPVYNAGWISDDHQIIATAYQSITLFSGNTVSAGIDAQQNGGNGSNAYGDLGTHSINDYAGYISVQQIFFDRLLANAGIRYAYNTYFGDIAIPQAGITYKLTEETNVRASIGKGYRAPQIFEIYQLTPRNGTLQPEDLWNYEIGVSHIFGHSASIDVAAYSIDANNTIVDAWGAGMKSWNTGGFHQDGIECSAQLFLMDNFTVNANYSFTDKPDLSQAVPKHKAYLGGEYRWKFLTVVCSAQYVNTIYGTDATDFMLKKLSDYTNVEIRVIARATENISFSIGSRNVLNESYQTIYGYPMPGRTVNAGINVHL